MGADSVETAERARAKAACSLQWPLVDGAGMGAAAFAAMSDRYVSITGLAGISLEDYATCLGAHLAVSVSVPESVQVAHHSDVRMLLQDLVDRSQPRFGGRRVAAEGHAVGLAADAAADRLVVGR